MNNGDKNAAATTMTTVVASDGGLQSVGAINVQRVFQLYDWLRQVSSCLLVCVG